MVYDLKYMMLCMDVVPFAILVFRTLMTILFQFLFTFSLTLSAVFKDAQTILGILLGLIFAHSLMLFAICPSVRPFSTIFLKNSPVRDSRTDDDGEVRFIMEEKAIDTSQLVDKTDEEKEMYKVMGFLSFDTTKEKHVIGNQVYVANVVHKRKYRQYMNRRGGFNRPLDFIA